MKRTITTIALAALLAVGAAVPIGAVEEEPEWEPVLELERVFFKCDVDGTPVRATAWNAARPLLGSVSWSHVPPAGSVFDGEGCLNADPGSALGPIGEQVSELSFAGTLGSSTPTNLDNLTFIIYALSMGFPDASWPVEFSLSVNGLEVVPPTAIDERPRDSNGGVTNDFEITVTDLGFVAEEDYGEFEVEITFGYDDGDRVTAWAWDTSEAPSGVWANNPPSTPHITISAERPDDPPSTEPPPSEPPSGPPSVGLGAQIVTTPGPTPMFLPPSSPHMQGATAQLTNVDTNAHDVTSLQRDSSGQRLFQSDILNFGQTGAVHGTQNLAPGTYAYYCTLHPAMTGELVVS